MSVLRVLQHFLKQEEGRPTLCRVERRPAQAARYVDWPEKLRGELRQALELRGVHQLYSHQRESLDLTWAERNVVVVTPTASGKTLCYNLPVIQSIIEDPNARALYLFPTKALAQDQLAELTELSGSLGKKLPLQLGAFTYDGDTPADARKAVRSRAHVVITNPDMLHTGILPHHTRWSRFLGHLRYVVVDELHTYRGVFGSHLANLFRRLTRLCRFHGSDPLFIMSSATIANPLELAENLIERPCKMVNRNGAPVGEKTVIFYNPPVINKELGIRRSYITASRRIASLFLKHGVKTIVFAGSRLNVEVLTRYLKDRFERTETEVGKIRGYRGGYLPTARREIERGLREGTVQGVISTNALELGIDIGALDAAVLAGYPGTVASTWQQAGRAGRRQGDSAVVLVAKSDPLDQFLMQNPDFFFEQSPEHARVNPDNLAILVSHVKCAAFELPLDKGERLGRAEVTEIAEYLGEKGVLHESGGQYHWTQEVYPADMVSLRSSGPENFVIMDVESNNRVIAEVDWQSAPSTVYEDAIYMCEARTYIVKKLDYAQRRAYVKPVEVDYYTDAITSTSVKILDSFQRQEVPPSGGRRGEPASPVGGPMEVPPSGGRRGELASPVGGPTEVPPPGGRRGELASPVGPELVIQEHGEVHVTWRVSGFKKIKFYSRENVGYGEVHLPDHEMHTTSFWLTFKESFLKPLGIDRADLLDGVLGLAYCLHHVSPLYLMCDLRDIDRCVGDRAGSWFARPDDDQQGRYSLQPASPPENEALSESWMRLAAEEQSLGGGAWLKALNIFEPTIFLYDSYPGGMGFSSALFDLFPQILERVAQLLEACPCESGCPGCVGPPQEVGSRSREVAQALTRAMLTA